ncbi:sigma 54 modulation/S30EA ribosomal C-terminal domain-containing protein [Nocardia inohanensis]|uniref:sigma 54 modulation/S30EA ribosomal C-terminal domain-containing protein n=1 Tax=Nocardia inohanensis TaxID=209246 RepID=UPI000A078EBF|nr:sigma 54 modulation/S30EA ribosomal C-terminal domain-containing protein [Nocardia inohanensis]
MSARGLATVVEPEVEVVAAGGVDDVMVRRARRVIGQLLRRHHLGQDARIRLTALGNSHGTTIAQVNVKCAGRPVRAQADGPGGFALTFAAERLDRQLTRLLDLAPPRWEPDPGRAPLAYAGAEKPVVHWKTVVPMVGDVRAAVAAMDAMDYDAHLFTDRDTGEDALVYWAGPTGVRLARQHHTRPPREITALRLTVNPQPTRELTEAEAAARLCRYGLPFLFYTDAEAGRGRLLYRRYDGNLGLVLAAGSAAVRPS